jgi:hypothetical protein
MLGDAARHTKFYLFPWSAKYRCQQIRLSIKLEVAITPAAIAGSKKGNSNTFAGLVFGR